MAKRSLGVFSYVRSVIDECKKVVWPTRDLVLRHSLMVVVAIIISTIIFASADYGLQKLAMLAIIR